MFQQPPSYTESAKYSKKETEVSGMVDASFSRPFNAFRFRSIPTCQTKQ
jgi:hypothetical protein